MLTGKAVSRAIRGHSLVVSALNVLIMKQALTEDGDDVKEVKCQFEKLLNGEIFISDIKANVALNHLIRRIDDFKASTAKCRMPKL